MKLLFYGKIKILPLLALIAVIFMGSKMPEGKAPYKNPKLPIEERVSDLLKRMTLEEKIDLLGGTGFATKPIERLGIPELKMSDGPLGVRWEKSTAFPSGIAMGATWEPELIEKIGQAIGREVKSKGRHVILGPCVNIARIPQGGRNFESFGEDPFLTTQMTVPYIKGVQKENVAATVKHFACNNQEFQRMFVDVKVDERSLNEIYLPAFKAAVQDADVWAVMCAYNTVNGHFASENDYLLLDMLKKQWGFNWLVMSDWGAVHSSIPVAQGGLDLEMPTGEYLNQKTLMEAVKNGTVKESVIDDKVTRILRVIFKLGLFENPGKEDKSLLGTKENRQAAYETERAGIVLLKNSNNILPLNLKNIKSIAVIGPNAKTLRTGGGGSSMVSPLTSVSPLEALEKALGKKVKINFAKGVETSGDTNPISSDFLFTDESGKEHGLKGEYFSNMDLSGTPAFTRVDKEINFDYGDGGPKEGFQKDKFSVRWTGYVKVAKSGDYIFDFATDDGARFYLDDQKLAEDWTDHALTSIYAKATLEAGKYYKLRMEFYENGGGAAARLGWKQPEGKLLEQAINAAKNSDVALIFAGTNFNVETEGRDRDNLVLPDGQDELIKEVAKANKNVVVVLTSGSPVLMDQWLNDVQGVFETWFGGELMSDAIVDVLTGKYNPSGKLPVTFPHKWEDCSAYNTYKSQDSVTYYSDGIYVGYRHFEKNNIKPLFPFGYGLSYTDFKYSDIKVSPADKDGKVQVSFSIQNTGKVMGGEVAQLYLRDVESSIDRPMKELKGFKKVYLKPGEKKTVTLTLDKNAMSYFDPAKKSWVMEPGKFEVLIGSSSEDIRLTGSFSI
ncbi:MAG TPA: glycoside hydrolase family 3 C-terminal domain-containing protein [Ignavibacteriales bacterium]|nr:glycoside hydrolase family 3 C-terminal domain-containing protein [Ignavibacteriales bacterium]